MLADTEQFGTGCACHVTVTAAGALLPAALLATTLNAFGPVVEDEIVHDTPELAQPVHTYVEGLPLHDAVSTTALLTVGKPLLVESEHVGTVGVVVPPLFQSASKPILTPAPALLAACTA